MSEVHPVYELDLWYFLSACATRLQELWYQPREEIDASLLRKLETSYLHQCLWRFHQTLVVEFKEESLRNFWLAVLYHFKRVMQQRSSHGDCSTSPPIVPMCHTITMSISLLQQVLIVMGLVFKAVLQDLGSTPFDITSWWCLGVYPVTEKSHPAFFSHMKQAHIVQEWSIFSSMAWNAGFTIQARAEIWQDLLVSTLQVSQPRSLEQRIQASSLVSGL